MCSEKVVVDEHFQAKFESVYGAIVWKHFKDAVSFDAEDDIHTISNKIANYVGGIDCKSNFYSPRNRSFTRFVLITLEKYYGSDSTKMIHLSDSDRWHIEHIKSKSSGINNQLGNLTLISADLNTCDVYAKGNFTQKRSVMKNGGWEEFGFTINEIFRTEIDDSKLEETIQERDKKLKKEFKDIFKDLDLCYDKVLALLEV